MPIFYNFFKETSHKFLPSKFGGPVNKLQYDSFHLTQPVYDQVIKSE